MAARHRKMKGQRQMRNARQRTAVDWFIDCWRRPSALQ